MKAIVYTQYGSPDVLHIREVEKPSPKENELRIKVRAVEATKADCELRSFNLPVKWTWLPLRLAWGIRKPRNQILGSYFAGEVDAVGSAVTKFAVGDAVFGCAGFGMGAYGEYVCVSAETTLAPKPTNMTFAEAAAVPLGGLNALHFMRKANIQPGEQVLINGAGGSIGSFGVQIAKTMGAEVTAVDNAEKEEMVRQLGADHYIDYTKEDFSQNGQRYDVIFDMVAQSSYASCLQSLKPNGRLLLGNPRFSKMIQSAFTSRRTDKAVTFAFAAETEEELLTLKQMIEAGQLQSPLDSIMSMAQAAEAHHRVESEQRVGIVVISMGE